MKVRYLVDCFPNLTETFVLNQITGLIERGFEVQIIAMTPGDTKVVHPDVSKYQLLQKTSYLFEHQLPAKRFPRILGMLARLGRHLFKPLVWRALFSSGSQSLQMRIYLTGAVATVRVDDAPKLTIAHFGPTAVFAARLNKLGILKGPIVPVFHGFDLSEKKVLQTNTNSYLELFQSCPSVLTISQHWADKLTELGCPRHKIRVNRMGINCAVFEMIDANTPLSSHLRILTVARLTEKKGLMYAIDAIANLKALGYTVQLDIIGTGPLEAALLARIKDLALQDSVCLLGAKNQQDVREQLRRSDVFLLPSVTAENGDKEGIPVSLMEAMACGIICVSTYHSGIPELIQHGYNGLLVNERDSAALSRELATLIEGRNDIATLRHNARETVSKEFNQQYLYDDLAKICHDIGASFV